MRLDIRYFLGYKVDESCPGTLPSVARASCTWRKFSSTCSTMALPSVWPLGSSRAIPRSWNRPRSKLMPFLIACSKSRSDRCLPRPLSASAAGHIGKAALRLAFKSGVDILINNVGGSSAPSGGFAALTDADWDEERA